MASSKYRRMLSRLIQQIDGASAEEIGQLFDLPPTQRYEIRTSRTPSAVLVEKLEQRKVVSEQNVSGLIEGLQALNLVAAATIVEEYKDVRGKLQTNVGNDICPDHAAELSFFCFTCDCGICYQCFLKSHEKHDVITMETVEQEQSTRYDTNLSLITESNNFLDTARASLLKTKRAGMNKRVLFDFVIETIATSPKQVVDLASLERALDESGDLLKSKETSLRLSSQSTKMLPLHRIKMQNEITKQINRVGKDVSLLKAKLESSRSSIAGLNWLLSNQLIIVFDQRKDDNKITLRCVNPKKISEINFEFSIRCDENENSFPLVVSPITYWIDGADSMLIAAGQSVYVVRLQWKVDKYVSPKGETKAHILPLPPDTYITSIDAHNRSSNRKHEFIVSINSFAKILRFNAKLNRVAEVDVNEVVSSVEVASCVDGSYAVIDSAKNYVTLVDEGSDRCKVVGQIFIKENDKDTFPLQVLWRGTAWLVLWVKITSTGNSREAKWIVSVHERTGKFLFSSKSEKFTGSDFPTSFTRFEFDVAVGLSDGAIKLCSSKEGHVNWLSAGCFDF